MSYTESKKKLDTIRQEYGCKGEVIFRTAIQYVVDHGRELFNEDDWYEFQMDGVDKRHDKAEAENKILFVSRDFEKAILECARELAHIKAYDLLIYIQREVWLGGNGIDYQRAIDLCKGAISWMVADTYETEVALDGVREMGFSDDEIDELGFGWMIDVEDEEEQ